MQESKVLNTTEQKQTEDKNLQQEENVSSDDWANIAGEGVSYTQVYVYFPQEIKKKGDYSIMNKFKGDKEFGEYFWATAFGDAVPGSTTIFDSQRSNAVSFDGVNYQYTFAQLRIPGVEGYDEYYFWLVELYKDPNQNGQPTARFLRKIDGVKDKNDIKKINASKKDNNTISVEISFTDQNKEILTFEIDKSR